MRFVCYFEFLWVRWGVVRVEYFGVKFGRFGEILFNDWKVDIECTLLSECTFFWILVVKFYDFGESVIFGSGDRLKSVDFTRDLGDFWSGEIGDLFDLFFVKIDDF